MRREWDKTALDNTASYIFYFDRLTELAISMFEWKNLPKSIDYRFMELALFHKGKAIFFRDEDLKDEENPDGLYLALNCAIGGKLDYYNIPIERRAYANNGYNRNLDNTNSVIIYNNMLHSPTAPLVKIMAERMYDFDKAIEVNAKAQKTPILITCDESQRLTLKNMYQQYVGNMPVIFGNKDIKTDTIKAIDTNAPYVADKLYDLKNRYWNETLTYLGITNMNVQKKERLVSDEAVRSIGSIIASRYSRLESRREAAQKINDMFGLNIEVDFRDDFREADSINMFEGDSGEDGKITTMANEVGGGA